MAVDSPPEEPAAAFVVAEVAASAEAFAAVAVQVAPEVVNSSTAAEFVVAVAAEKASADSVALREELELAPVGVSVKKRDHSKTSRPTRSKSRRGS